MRDLLFPEQPEQKWRRCGWGAGNRGVHCDVCGAGGLARMGTGRETMLGYKLIYVFICEKQKYNKWHDKVWEIGQGVIKMTCYLKEALEVRLTQVENPHK